MLCFFLVCYFLGFWLEFKAALFPFGVEGVCVSLGFRVSGFGAWGFLP